MLPILLESVLDVDDTPTQILNGHSLASAVVGCLHAHNSQRLDRFFFFFFLSLEGLDTTPTILELKVLKNAKREGRGERTTETETRTRNLLIQSPKSFPPDHRTSLCAFLPQPLRPFPFQPAQQISRLLSKLNLEIKSSADIDFVCSSHTTGRN